MPVSNKPLPPIHDHQILPLPTPDLDLIAQVREATYSPSPLIKILQDPTLMPTKSMRASRSKELSDNTTHQGATKRPSRSPGRREHKPRSPYVAAIAIMEEERQAQHLKYLLRVSADRLEQEMRRADDANLKAQFLELREQEGLSRVKAVEKLNLELRDEILHLERDTREAQMSLEASQREMRRLQEDVEEARMELEATQHSERKAQEQLQQYKAAVRNLEEQARDRLADMQRALDQCYNDGREDGYDEGYDAGYEEGRTARKKKTKRVLVDDREDIFNSYKDM